jgi:hypothetical protein
MTSPQPPTRAELASFIRDQRTLRAFERLFEAVPGDTLALQAIVDEVAAGAQVAADTATAARSDALRLADAIENLGNILLTQRSANISALEKRVSELESLLLAQR